MAYDEHLEERIRALLPDEPGITSKKMFGGLAFMLDGNMAVGVSNDELMVRVDPDSFDDLVAGSDVRPFEMGGRGMKGWILAGGEAIAEEQDLERWIDIGMGYAGSLPPK
jgi:hypothetical protein